MSVFASLNQESSPAPWSAAAAGRRMSHADAAAVVVLSVGVVILTLTAPKHALGFLLAFPIWIVAKDMGLLAGAVVAGFALLFVGIVGTTDSVAFGPLGYLAEAAVFAGAVIAGAQVLQPNGTGEIKRISPLLRLLTARPEIMRRQEALSRRELEILGMVATGAKNAEIADQLVISQNTVKSHVSQILKKLPAANRTEAAFHYVELYGPPTPSDRSSTTVDVAEQAESAAQIGASSAVGASVSAFRRKDRVLLTLQDGRDLEVPLLEPIRSRAGVGTSAIVYFDPHDRVVGWYLPEEELGVDLRHWEP
jgi:DNA-binding CsgD family transcriptional regulator